MNYNTRMVSKITGLTVRKISYWDSNHLIKPSIQGAQGTGSTRLYSFMDLVQLKVVKSLRDSGMSLQKIRKSISYIKKHLPEIQEPLSDLRFITDGIGIFVITKDDRKIIDTLKQGQLILHIALGSIVEELKGEVNELNAEKRYEVKVMGEKHAVVLHTDSEDGGFWAEAINMPGCVSQGETIEETLDMMKDAIKGYKTVLSTKKKSRKAS